MVSPRWNCRLIRWGLTGWLVASVFAALCLPTAGLAQPSGEIPPADLVDGSEPDSPLTDEPVARLSDEYGFLPLELFKLTDRIEFLRVVDLNGDDRLDLVVADNGESRVEMLLQRPPDEDPADPNDMMLQVNELTDSWRFDRQGLPIDRRVEDLQIGDFNGDGRPDLAYTGDNELVVRLNRGLNDDGELKWSGPRKVTLADSIVSVTWQIAVGDLNADGSDDLAILGSQETLLVEGYRDERPESLERLPATTQFDALWVADVNRDQRPDLAYLEDDADEPLVVRLQQPNGSFGPEQRLRLAAPRAMDLLKLDAKSGTEIVSIEQSSGRVRLQRVTDPEAETTAVASPPVLFGFGRGSNGRNRLLGVGDLNADGRTDVVVVDSEQATMSVYLQEKSGGLGSPVEFPGLTGIRSLALADVDGDGRSEVYLASEREKVIAMSRYTNGRLSYPRALPTTGTPMALCLADLEGNGRRDLAYVSSSRPDGGRPVYQLHKLTYDRNEGWIPGEFNGMTEVALDDLRSPPGELLPLDADRDGRSDLLVLSSNAPALFLPTSSRGVPQPSAANSSDRLGNVAPGQVTLGQLDGPAILITQSRFARRVALDTDGQWSVLDQYNADSPNAGLAATAILDVDGDDEPEIVLADPGTRQLRILRKQDGLYRPWQTLEIGLFALESLKVADFNSDGRQDLLLFGPQKFAIVYSGRDGLQLVERGTFETELRDARLGNFAAGDLGGGPEPELALVDTDENRLEIITLRDGQWLSALQFPIFEAGPNQSGAGEPREIVVADVTGDGLHDLIMIAHDRILLYPQDPGEPAEAETDAVSRPAE